jgi:chorismate mutase
MNPSIKQLFPFLEDSQVGSPFLIAGPCSVETPEQLDSTVGQLAANGVTLIRAGIWKPRTRPNGFEGLGSLALPWLHEVKKKYTVKIATEVANAYHVEEALKAGIDVLWIGARSTVNPFTVTEIADSLRGIDIPVLVKNPINPDLGLWLGAIERLEQAGLPRIGAIHRGFSNFRDTLHRNSPMWELPIEFRTLRPELVLINDPSHIAGKRALVKGIAQHALDLNFDGLMIESHSNPDAAWTDAAQQLSPANLNQLFNELITRNGTFSSVDGSNPLEELRKQIDEVDRGLLEVLSRRMHLVEKIGAYKKVNNVSAFQLERWLEILNSRPSWAKTFQLNPEVVKELFRIIHQESIRKQTEWLEE